MTTTIEDLKGGMSSCCSAEVYSDLGICAECGEHCDEIEEECEFCGGTGEIDTYYRGEDTGYNYVVDGTKPCICQVKDKE